MKFAKAVWIAVYIINPAIPTALFFNVTKINVTPAVLLFYGSGIFAYTWFTNEIIIAARPKFIERHFGLDRLLLFHILSSLTALGCGLLHTALVESVIRWSPSLGREIGSFTLGVTIALFSVSALFFTTIFTDLHPLLTKTRKWLLKTVVRFDFQIIRLIHNLFVLATLGFLLHILFTTILVKYPQAKWIFIAEFALPLAFYTYHKGIRLLRPRYRFIVENVVKETENTLTVIFKPEKPGRIYPYAPGQFAFIRFLNRSILLEEHPFSISSNPLNTGNISVTVKNLGNYTALLEKLKPGTKAVIDYPYGSFSIPEISGDKGIVLIAGGIGITPFISHLAYLKEKNSEQNVTLVWGIRRPEDIIKKEFFHELERTLANFRFIPIISRHRESDGREHAGFEKGYFDDEKARRLIPGPPENNEYYICGPRIMMLAAKDTLKGINVNKNQIHMERFSM